MDLKSKHKVDASFSMSSMTDIIFLLLVFFMLTSSFITPSGLQVNLPKSKQPKVVMQHVTVSITKNLRYAVNDKRVKRRQLERALSKALKGTKGSTVTLHVDEKVPVEHLMHVAGIVNSLDAKIAIAAKPQK
ncbi:MAG: biopolymer transporter ExbD [Cytophagales bacterium]|nr:biopolymer transporter ExbD [Cytophagales bacterium]